MGLVLVTDGNRKNHILYIYVCVVLVRQQAWRLNDNTIGIYIINLETSSISVAAWLSWGILEFYAQSLETLWLS